MDLFELAGTAYNAFEVAHRGDDPEQPFTRLKDEHKDTWLQDLVYDAHGEFLPDDWRYDCTRSACGWIHDNEPADLDDARSEFADSAVDVYNMARCAWLASDLRRGSYCDEAAQEFGFTISDERGVFDLIALGQYAEAEEVFSAVADALEKQLGEQDDD